MARFTIHPCADEHQNSLKETMLIGEADDIATAKQIAVDNSGLTFGTGIKDHATGQIDVGFGFGVDVPPIYNPDSPD